MRKLVKLTSRLFLNSKCPLWLQRKGLNLLGGYGRKPKGMTIIKKDQGGVPVWWFKPRQFPARKAIIYFHGGGYGIGSPKSHRDLCSHLSAYASIPLVSVAYRLAPEHPYPAALDDAQAVYQSLLEQGFQPEHLAFAGDSAGGGLALALALRCQQQRVPQPGCLFLISPWVNKSRETASHRSQYAVDPVINEGWSLQMARNYLSDSEAIKAEACMTDKDLTGLPPMLIHVGTDEVLLDDSLSLKQEAMRSGIPVTLMTYPEMWHVFHFSASLFAQAREALQQAAGFIQKRLS
ncbi:alpha/beta hydrolase [Marinicella sediminis]|nr:alpha/beta hydrolase [Marinicella sediminis]